MRVLFVAAALTAAALVAGSARADPRPLCHLGATVRALLDCHGSTSSAASPAQAQPAAAPASVLRPAPPVALSSTTPTYVPNVLIVGARVRVGDPRLTTLLQRNSLQVQNEIPALRDVTVYVPPDRRAAALVALNHSPLIASIGRDEVLHTLGAVVADDTFFDDQWGLQLAGFTTAWERTRGDPIVVAVVDTGVDASQPDLAGRVLPGVDLVNGDSDASDDNGHGTAVAGVIAARGDNSIGGAGVCWMCQILPIKAMGADGSGDLATVAAGIVRAADLGARVINLSLGGPAGLDALQQAIDYAEGKGAVVVAAAGNSGLTTPFYPAAYTNVVSVAGTNQSDQLYPWSDYGHWVSLAAPGCNVAPVLSGGYGEFCGTSSAAPLVAGLAALALSAQPDASAAQVTSALDGSAQQVSADVAFGRIDAATAIDAIAGTTIVTHTISGTSARSYTTSIAAGTVTATLRFHGKGSLTLTLRDGALTITKSGHSPVSVTAQAAAGTLTVSVRGKARYTLAIAYPR